jgi:hypothetical protein
MANNNPTTLRHDVRLRLCFNNGFKSYTIAVPTFRMQPLGVEVGLRHIAGLAQGRIVSISRGSPPPKKR